VRYEGLGFVVLVLGKVEAVVVGISGVGGRPEAVVGGHLLD
jgi:hypothetical protein